MIKVLICKGNLLLAKFIKRFYDSVLTKINTLHNLIEHTLFVRKRVERSKKNKM